VKLFVDLESLQLIEGPGFRNPVTALRFKRGDAARLEVAFLRNGSTPATIGDPQLLELHFGVKPRGRYDIGYLVHSSDWTSPDPGAENPVYRSAPSFNTVELDSALGVGSSTGSELAEITLMGEITWREGDGEPTSTRTFIVIVENDVNRGTEGTPSALPNAVDFLITQGVLPLLVDTDADKLDLTDLKAGQVVIITNEAKRIEQYLGGTISNQTSWAVLRNTVQLSVSIPTGSGNNITVNGAGIANSATPTSAGWVNPHAVPMGAQGSTTLTLGQITSKTTGTNVATITTPSTSIPVGTTVQTHALPVALPDRGVVTLVMTYPAA